MVIKLLERVLCLSEAVAIKASEPKAQLFRVVTKVSVIALVIKAD